MTRNRILLAVSIFGAALAFQASAEDSHEHHATDAAKPAAAADAAMTNGEVRKVDKAAGKVSIKHGFIRKFDMPPMTMAYHVKDKALLQQLKPGDKIKFDVERAGDDYTVVRLEKVK